MTGHAIYPSLNGRTVLITGGGSGIGADIVRGFARQGAKVGFLDIQEEPSRALVAEVEAAGGTVAFAACDLRDIEAMRTAIGALRERLGPFAILINNAAHDERHDFLSVTPDYFDDRIAVNLKHFYFAAQAVIPDMKAQGAGSIVNIGSNSWLVGAANLSAYGTAKAASLGFTRMLAREFGPDNIRVNTVIPGWIMTQRQIDLWLTPEGEKQLMESQCLKRRLIGEDIAKAVLFVASDEASGMTNQSLIVDGGWH